VQVTEILQRAVDSVHVRRVFGEPIERDGALVVPVAVVRGGGGGGEGGSEYDEGRAGNGSGGGFGISARPAGMYVVKGGDAHWRPALDVNRAILGGQVVAVVVLLVLRSLLRRR
jgi:uncharacterized spore protein YtfJ